MRFEFCGKVSCPEWFIAEISVLTKITAVKMKLVFSQLIAYYLESEAPDISSKISKLLNGTGLDVYEMNAVVSTLNFILQNSVQFHVTDVILNKELIDLGLPKENVETNRDKLLERSLDRMPKITSGLEIEYSLHQFLGSSQLGSKSINPIRFCEMNWQHILDGKKVSTNFIMTEDDLDELIFQMEDALLIVDKLEAGK